MGIIGLVRPQNASYIIERTKHRRPDYRLRGEIHCLKRAFPSRGSILGECNGCGGGDETSGHQQTDDFPVASHKINGSPCVFLGESRISVMGERCKMR